MSVLETSPAIQDEQALPPGVTLSSGVTKNLGRIMLPAGQVLIARLDNEVIDGHNSHQAQEMARLFAELGTGLRSGLVLGIEPIPDDRERRYLGLWLIASA